MVDQLEKSNAILKAKYKQKIIVKTEELKAQLGIELYAVKAELERKNEALTQREAELQVLYQRLEELEML